MCVWGLYPGPDILCGKPAGRRCAEMTSGRMVTQEWRGCRPGTNRTTHHSDDTRLPLGVTAGGTGEAGLELRAVELRAVAGVGIVVIPSANACGVSTVGPTVDLGCELTAGQSRPRGAKAERK